MTFSHYGTQEGYMAFYLLLTSYTASYMCESVSLKISLVFCLCRQHLLKEKVYSGMS